MNSFDIAAITGKPWPLVRLCLTGKLGLGDRLDSASDAYAMGYLSRATRMDLGKICSRGKPCGNSCVPRKRECKSATSKAAQEASDRARKKLIEELKAQRDQKRVERSERRKLAEQASTVVSETDALLKQVQEMTTKARKQKKRQVGPITDPEFQQWKKTGGGDAELAALLAEQAKESKKLTNKLRQLQRGVKEFKQATTGLVEDVDEFSNLDDD